MNEHTTRTTAVPELSAALLTLLAAYLPAFRQTRTYQRAVALVFGELFTFARHTVTQSLLALGLSATTGLPSAGFSVGRGLMKRR